MAEAACAEFSYFRQCIFCNAKLSDEYQVRKHLEEVHGISGNTTITDKKYVESARNLQCSLAKECEKNLHLNDKIKLMKNTLKENFPRYLEILKLWIRCEISNEDFYQEVRAFFTPETIDIHNEFLISFMKEIRSITKGSNLSFRNKSNFITEVGFSSASSSTDMISSNEKTTVPTLEIKDPKNISRSNCHATKHTSLRNSLPDLETMNALILVNAWENECYSIDKRIVPYIRNAAEVMIKNILLTLQLRRNNYSLQSDEWNLEKLDSLYESGSEQLSEEITLQELFDCLEAQPNLIPMKSVYKCTLQRLIQILKQPKMKTDVCEEKKP